MEDRVPLAARVASRLGVVAGRGRGAALALWGPPGIGTSHVARTVLGRLTCDSATVRGGDGVPVWAEAFRLGPRVPTWALRALDRLRAGDAVPTADAAHALLAAWGAVAPFVLLIDDLHEASPELRALAEALARGVVRTRGAGLLVTMRGRPAAPFEGWALAPMAAEEEADLLAGALGAPPPSAALEWLRARAEGNPLVALEHLRFLRRTGALWDDGDGWRWREPDAEAIPRTLEALIERRLQALAVDARDVLAAAVYLPRDAPDEARAVASDLPEERRRAALSQLVDLGLLVARPEEVGGGHDVAHPTVREVARRTLTEEQRQVFAARIVGRWADAPETAAEFVADGGIEGDAALDLLRGAATAAEAAGKAVAAARFRARAVAFAAGADRGQLALQAARGLVGHDLAAVEALGRIAVAEGAGPEAVRILAGALIGAGRHDDAAAALDLLPPTEREGMARARHEILIHGGAGNAPSALATWRAHPELRADPDPALAYAVGFALVVVGEHAGAGALAEAALARAAAPLDRCRLSLVVGLARVAGPDPAEALAHYDVAVAIAREHELGAWLAAALHNRAIVNELLGRDTAVMADVEEALAVYGRAGDAVKYASTQTKLARHLVEMGRYARAEELLLAARETLNRASLTPFLVTCECVLAQLYDTWRPVYGGVLALEHAANALRLAGEMGVPAKLMQAQATVAAVEAEHGDVARAIANGEALVAAVAERGDLISTVDALVPYCRALAAAGRRAEAVTQLERAAAIASTFHREATGRVVALDLALVRRDDALVRREHAWLVKHGLTGLASRGSRYLERAAAPAARAKPIGSRGDSQTTDGAASSASGPGPWLDVLGIMRVRQGDTVEPVIGDRRRVVLALLLEARLLEREGVDRLELVDRLYPHLAEDRAHDALKQLVYQLRRRLGTSAIVLRGKAYALGAVATDAEAFLNTGDTRLWRGPALLDEGADQARALLVRRLSAAVATRLDDDPAEAARLAHILVEAEPYDADALTLVIRAQQAAGETRGLDAWYRDRRARFAEVGERLPERWSSLLSSAARA